MIIGEGEKSDNKEPQEEKSPVETTVKKSSDATTSTAVKHDHKTLEMQINGDAQGMCLQSTKEKEKEV